MDYLHSLISEGEHQQQDFKYKVQDAAKLARSVSAFANTDGGRLLIGVRDDGHVSGVRSAEETYMMERAARVCCRPASEISFETVAADGRTVVIATIPKAVRRPVFAIGEDGRRTAFVRVKDENVAASPVHLEMWRQERASMVVTAYGEAEATLLRVLQEHRAETLNRLVRLSRLPRGKAVRTLARFVRYGLAVMTYEDGRFTFSPV